MTESNEMYEQMMKDCRSDEPGTDFKALISLIRNLKYSYHQNRAQAAQAARSAGHWSDRDIDHAVDLVFNQGW